VEHKILWPLVTSLCVCHLRKPRTLAASYGESTLMRHAQPRYRARCRVRTSSPVPVPKHCKSKKRGHALQGAKPNEKRAAAGGEGGAPASTKRHPPQGRNQAQPQKRKKEKETQQQEGKQRQRGRREGQEQQKKTSKAEAKKRRAEREGRGRRGRAEAEQLQIEKVLPTTAC
jgi:hypothetical protein